MVVIMAERFRARRSSMAFVFFFFKCFSSFFFDSIRQL